MSEKTETQQVNKEERRTLTGTWPLFVLNIIVFPAPAHLTLLRIRDFSSGKNWRHIGMTLLLFLVLFAAAFLQLTVPAVGRLWLLFPALSGLVVLYLNRSLKADFKPFDFSEILREKKGFLMGLITLFVIISLLPSLNLIELNQKPTEAFVSWIGKLPFWQDILILFMSLLLLFTGYIINAAPGVSINRALILYACFIIIEIQLFMVLIFTYSWLKIQGGFWLQLIISLLSALLALDYRDAVYFGQYLRRFFFLTFTKGFSIVFLILCFYGLPQKTASVFSEYYYKKVRPAPIELSCRHLIFTDKGHFISGHKAAQRIRALYTRSITDHSSELMKTITELVNKHKGTLIPADADICQTAELISRNFRQAGIDLKKVPLFRPIRPDWDVMFTALLSQDLITGNDLDKHIAGFKKKLPKATKGKLPYLETPFDAGYVSLATDIQADYIEPRFEDMMHLWENNFHPVLTLRLSGTDYWAALLFVNRESGLAWFRIQTASETHKAIQLLFDANESKSLQNEIFTRLIVPVSIDYLRNTLLNHSAPIIIFSKNGLAKAMPERFSPKDLEEIKSAIAISSISCKNQMPNPAVFKKKVSNHYAGYLFAMTQVKLMLSPETYGSNIFSRPPAGSLEPTGIKRLHKVSKILESQPALRENDRMEIASLLARHNHVYGLPELFIKLASPKPFSNGLIDCQEAETTGRKLFLLGYHKEAYPYLHLAFLRHPFKSEYELWYQITRAKLKMPQLPFYSPKDLKPGLALYYRTITDINKGESKKSRKRLEKILEKDSHNSLANHLLSRYFGQPLNDRHFFTSQEGL